MNIGEYSVTNKVTTWLLVILFLAGGLTALQEISRLEDPEFTIKDAKIYTLYPGATPNEVEREITYHIENAIQELSQLWRVESISQAGFSEVTVKIKKKYKKLLYAIWKVRKTPKQIREEYRKRFGVETSYRQMNEARIRTCSPSSRNTIDARPRGPNQPMKATEALSSWVPMSEMATGSMRISVRLSSAYKKADGLKSRSKGTTRLAPKTAQTNSDSRVPRVSVNSVASAR